MSNSFLHFCPTRIRENHSFCLESSIIFFGFLKFSFFYCMYNSVLEKCTSPKFQPEDLINCDVCVWFVVCNMPNWYEFRINWNHCKDSHYSHDGQYLQDMLLAMHKRTSISNMLFTAKHHSIAIGRWLAKIALGNTLKRNNSETFVSSFSILAWHFFFLVVSNYLHSFSQAWSSVDRAKAKESYRLWARTADKM